MHKHGNFMSLSIVSGLLKSNIPIKTKSVQQNPINGKTPALLVSAANDEFLPSKKDINTRIKEAGFCDSHIDMILSLPDIHAENAIRLKHAGIEPAYAIENSTLDNETVDKIITLRTSGFDSQYSIYGAKKLSKESVANVILLRDSGFSGSLAISKVDSLSSRQIENIVRLKKAGLSDFHSQESSDFSDEYIENIIKLKGLGYSNADAFKACQKFSSVQIDKFSQYLSDGFNYDDAHNIAFTPENSELYQEYTYLGYDSKTSAIMANIANIEFYYDSEIAALIDSIKATENSDIRVSQLISDYLKNNPDINLSEFTRYINGINFEKLSDVAPDIKTFGPKELLEFADYHYKLGTVDFSKEALTLSEDMTQYLKENYVDAKTLTDLLIKFPATNRNVGSMPTTWIGNVSENEKEQASNGVYNSISDFQKSKDIKQFSKEMSDILGKQVNVEELKTGNYGTGYKLEMENAPALCLKIFSSDEDKDKNMLNIHGQHIEVQNGIFANEHSNDFVKMYFGRIAGFNCDDGFLVTQYLDENITPVETGEKETSYKVISDDTFIGHNKINGKIIDFGGIRVEEAVEEEAKSA